MTIRTDVIVGPQSSILDAVRVIDAASLQIALVTDEAGRLVGTLTDGDVRRGLLRGVKLDEPVASIMNTAPITVTGDTTPDRMIRIMQARGIEHLPVVDAAGRLIGLERLDALLEPPEEDTWVVLMAGGLGTRLHPVTQSMPKPMIPVGGKPMIQTIVEGFAGQGFRRFWFSVNYMAQTFVRHFGDGSNHGVRIDYLFETARKGTAGALSLLPETPTGPVIVMNADILTTVDFRQLMKFHRDHDAVATMCVREYSIQVPYGVVETVEHRLVSLQEKPVHSFFVNAGIYVLSPDAIARVPKDRFYDMPQLFNALMAEGLETAVFPLREYWMDIGRHEDLEQARSDIAELSTPGVTDAIS